MKNTLSFSGLAIPAPHGQRIQRAIRTAILSCAVLLLSCEFTPFRAWAADCVLTPTGLVAWWSAEGNANDRVGTNNGTLRGGATFVPGKVGEAFDFDGSGSVLVPDSPALRFTNGMTVEAWVYPRAWGAFREIVSKWFGAAGQLSFTTSIEPSGRAYFLVSSDGQTSSLDVDYAIVYTTGTVPLNQWSHFAATYDGAWLRIYLNGVLENQGPWAKGIFPGTAPLVIGECYSESLFNGLIDEPSLYNRALSTSEIAAIYQADSAGKCAGPLITAQPQSQVGNWGQTVSFTVAAVGTAPLGYQWQRNGTNLTDNGNISGSSTSLLTLSAITLDDASSYSVIITNSSGGVASSVATLTVWAPPSITVQPQSQAIHEGSNVVFGVSVAAYPSVNYQWAFNGTNILGATGASLLVANVQLIQSGSYSVAVTNSLGYEISTPATLTVLAPPQILSQPRSQIGYWGLGVSFQVHAVGTLPLSYQWYFEDFPIGWATNATLELQDLDLDAGGEYYVEVANLYGSAVSQAANLIVNPASVSPGIYFGLTITGAVGKRFGIQYVTNVNLTNSWTTITNITLAQPVQLWMDTSVNISASGQARRHYRAVAIP